MKVPFLNKKRKAELIELSTQFSAAINKNLSPTNFSKRFDSGWLNDFYPFFALLEILLNKRININPSREYALEGARLSGDTGAFLEAINSFNASPRVHKALRKAHSETIFSGFIEELRSDSIMAFINSLMYGYRGSAISLRCALEDLYRHLYYMDHPEEYRALVEKRETEHSLKLSPLAFREYLRKASYLQKFSTVSTSFCIKEEKDMDLFGLNDTLYAQLSSAVHGASSDWFAAIQNSSSLQFNEDREKKLANLGGDFIKMCIAFLISAHRDIFLAAGDYDKSIVLEAFSNNEKRDLRNLLNI